MDTVTSLTLKWRVDGLIVVAGLTHKLVTVVMITTVAFQVAVLVAVMLLIHITDCHITFGVGVQAEIVSSGLETVHLLGMDMLCTFVRYQSKRRYD
jgi:hypothetical protein